MEFDIEQEDGKTVVKSEEKHHTVMNLVRNSLWESGTEAGYEKGHPYVGESRLVISTEEAASAIEDAVDRAREQLDSFRDSFAR